MQLVSVYPDKSMCVRLLCPYTHLHVNNSVLTALDHMHNTHAIIVSCCRQEAETLVMSALN